MGPPEYGTVGMMTRNRLLFFLARRLPWFFPPLMWAMGRSCQEEEQARKSLLRSAPHLVEPDRACVLDPEAGGLLPPYLRELFLHRPPCPSLQGPLFVPSSDFYNNGIS